MEAHRVVKRRGPHIFWTIDSHMTARLSALRASRPPFTPQEDSWYSFLLEAESTPGLGQLKIPVTPWGIEPAIFRLVA
jgi:hypothetical protein